MSLALALAVLMGVFGLIFAWLAGWFGDIIFPDEDVPTQDDFKEALRQNPAAIREALRQVAAANGTTPGGGGAAAAAAAAARRVPQRPSDAELATQNARCKDVKQRSLTAAKQMCALGATSADAGSLNAALSSLQCVVDENEQDGALGVIATTELCNALLEADALNTLEALQSHADADVAKASTALFTHVIPRIWSF